MNEAQAYAKHRNLKLAASELGISWHTLYYRLKRDGVQIAGDKMRYGTDRDRLGALGEQEFHRLVPFAVSANATAFQAKYDFDVLGHKVDVKASLPRQLNKRYAAESWSFSFKKQSLVCDFIVCFCMDEAKATEHVLLVPSEFFRGLQTVSVARNGASKWLDYSIAQNDLADFFRNLP